MSIYSKFMLLLLTLTLFTCTKDTELIEKTNQPDSFALTMSEVTYNPCWVDQEMNLLNIPEAIKTYISSKYPNQSIEEAERLGENVEDFKAIEVEINDRIELLFDPDGNFIAEENESSKIVSSDSIPLTIQDYLETTYPGILIDEAQMKSEYDFNYFDIELSNGAKFLFDSLGQPLCQDEVAEAEIDGNDDGDVDDNEDDDGGNEDDD